MTIPTSLCSYCHENFLNCKCDQFHPNLREGFTISRDEAVQLHEHFWKRAGYISYEFDAPLHALLKRLNSYVKEDEQ